MGWSAAYLFDLCGADSFAALLGHKNHFGTPINANQSAFEDKRDASMLTLSANKAAAAGDWVSAS